MYQGEPVLLKVIGFEQPSCRLRRHPPLHVMPRGYKEGKFYYLFGLLFIEENKIKAFVYTFSQSAAAAGFLYQIEPFYTESLLNNRQNLFLQIKYKGRTSPPLYPMIYYV